MKRISPEKEINYVSNIIENNIKEYKALKKRESLSQNILSQLRNLVEDVAILINNRENVLSNNIYYDSIANEKVILKTSKCFISFGGEI